MQEAQQADHLEKGQQVVSIFSEKDIALYMSRPVEIQYHRKRLRQW